LTHDEAKEYTQLGTEFDLKVLDHRQKAFLAENFHAQVFAFRKLRERLLLSENPVSTYKKEALKRAVEKKPGILSPPKSYKSMKQAVHLSRDELEGMLKAINEKKDIKAQILDKANRKEIEAQLKLARRREYYYKRVKTGFAPNKDGESSDGQHAH